MAIPILTEFDRNLLLDLRTGRRLPKHPGAAAEESLQYMRAHGLIWRNGAEMVVTDAGRRASVEG